MRQLTGDKLTPEDRKHVLDAYIYRMTVESVKRWPNTSETMRDGGFNLPQITDEEWLQNTLFRVTKSGRLDKRARFCYSRRGVALCK